MPPDETGDFALGIADESCLGFDNLKKESRLAFRKDLNAALIRRLHEKLFTLAPEIEHEFRIVHETVLTGVLVKELCVDFDFSVLGLLCPRRPNEIDGADCGQQTKGNGQ